MTILLRFGVFFATLLAIAGCGQTEFGSGGGSSSESSPFNRLDSGESASETSSLPGYHMKCYSEYRNAQGTDSWVELVYQGSNAPTWVIMVQRSGDRLLLRRRVEFDPGDLNMSNGHLRGSYSGPAGDFAFNLDLDYGPNTFYIEVSSAQSVHGATAHCYFDGVSD